MTLLGQTVLWRSVVDLDAEAPGNDLSCNKIIKALSEYCRNLGLVEVSDGNGTRWQLKGNFDNFCPSEDHAIKDLLVTFDESPRHSCRCVHSRYTQARILYIIGVYW
jgi:hypothetical protein